MTCWMWGSAKKEDIIDQAVRLEKSIASCLDQKRPRIWLGFSNGGNYLTQVFQACRSPNNLFITFGASGGELADPKSQLPSNLSSCGRIFSAVGSADRFNLEHAKRFHSELIERSAQASFIEFEGKHELDISTLSRILEQIRK